MKKRVRSTVYALSVFGGLSSAAFASVGTQQAQEVTLPGYGSQGSPAQLDMGDLIQKCDEFERHEQVAKFTADITCTVDQLVWAQGRSQSLEINYEPSFAEFDINIKGKLNSDWVPLSSARRTFVDQCPSVEKWRVRAIKTVKVHSCDELRVIQNNPAFCEAAFNESQCIQVGNINSQIQGAQQTDQSEYDDQECHGHRLMEVTTGPVAVPAPLNAEDLASGTPTPVTYSEVSCSDLGLATPVHMVLKTIDILNGGKTEQGVQIVDLGEMQDKAANPELGLMSVLSGQLPQVNDVLWRINGRRVEKPEEVCRALGEQKALQGTSEKPAQIKMSFYRESNLQPYDAAWELVSSAQRQHLIVKY